MAIRQLAEMEARHRLPWEAAEVVDWVEAAVMAGMEEPLVAEVAAAVCLEMVAVAARAAEEVVEGHRMARAQMALLEEPEVEAAAMVGTMRARALPAEQMEEVAAVDKEQTAELAEPSAELGGVAEVTVDGPADMAEEGRALEAWVWREAPLASAVVSVAPVAQQEQGEVGLEGPFLFVKEARCPSLIQLLPQTMRPLLAREASMAKPLERTSM
jgi:hypothetical protein